MRPDRYAQPEIERRWLVDLDRVDLQGVEPKLIRDRYLECGRLRLRSQTYEGETVYKLCKKYLGTERFERITNIYLDKSEFEALQVIPARESRKRRYPIEGGGLDVYESGQAFFEREFASVQDADAYLPPDFALGEVTGDPSLSGYAMAAAK